MDDKKRKPETQLTQDPKRRKKEDNYFRELYKNENEVLYKKIHPRSDGNNYSL